MNKKFIAKLLALVLVLSMAPASILAANAASGSNSGCNSGCNQGCTGGGSTGDTKPVKPSNPSSGSSGSSFSGFSSVSSTTKVDAADITVKDDEAVITAKVVAGTANVVLSDSAAAALAEKTTGDELVLKIEAKNATRVDVSMSAKALTAMGKKSGAALTIESPIVTITIPNEALTTVFGDTGTVKITASASGNSVGFSIQLSGKPLSGIKGLQVTF